MQVGDIVITTSDFNEAYDVAGTYLGIVQYADVANVKVEFYDFMLPPSFESALLDMPSPFVRKADLQDLKPFIV